MTVDASPWTIEGAEPATHAAWRAAVDAVLTRRRGEVSDEELDRLFRSVLTTTTDDGIVLQPLYQADDAPRRSTLPGQHPFTRGGSATGPVPNGWDVRQRVVVGNDVAAANRAVLDELGNGATSIWLDLDGQPPSTDLLDAVLDDVHLDMAAVGLDAGPAATEASRALVDLWERRTLPGDAVRANLGFDPVGRYAATGGVEDAEIGLAAGAEIARTVSARFPHAATFVADGAGYHNGGASEADEVALALATSTEYLRTLVTAGLSVDQALAQVDVRLAATDNQFLTIAKLRAARVVLARVADVAGAGNGARAQRQHAVTSRAMLTRYDTWVNLLRTTVATFSAGVGGADAVTVEPHDLLVRPQQEADADEAAGSDTRDVRPSALGARLARNVSTILIMESHLGRVVDPAGGSWFVERLTDDLAARAWSRFQQIESAGGIVEALAAGLPQQWLASTTEQRRIRVAHRRQPITGVSEFPNLTDSAPTLPPAAAGPTPFAPVVPLTYAAPFERLRDRADAHASTTGAHPRVFLATLGPPAEHTARATFATNLFAAGGVEAVASGTVTAETVAGAFADSGATLVCICGADGRYADEAVDVAQALAGASPSRIYLAGTPRGLRDDLDAAGVHEYVVAGGDAADLLDRALSAAEVA